MGWRAPVPRCAWLRRWCSAISFRQPAGRMLSTSTGWNDPTRRRAGAVRGLLDARGYRVERVEQIVPSLEDVFVSLIEARDRAEQPQQEVRR